MKVSIVSIKTFWEFQGFKYVFEIGKRNWGDILIYLLIYIHLFLFQIVTLKKFPMIIGGKIIGTCPIILPHIISSV